MFEHYVLVVKTDETNASKSKNQRRESFFQHDYRAKDISVSTVFDARNHHSPSPLLSPTPPTHLITTSLTLCSSVGDWTSSLQSASSLVCVVAASPWSRSAPWRDDVHVEGPRWYDIDNEDADQSKCRDFSTPEEAREEFVRALLELTWKHND